jgi:hypothetical protein
MKTVIDIDRNVWGKVKDFATVRVLSLNSAVELLIMSALNSNGYSIGKEKKFDIKAKKDHQTASRVGHSQSEVLKSAQTIITGDRLSR